jgi:hypothetical protein
MEAIEFVSEVRNGMIEIPKEYQKTLSDKVRVIVLTNNTFCRKAETLNKKQKQNFSDFLKESVKISNFVMPSRNERNQR